MRKRLLLTAVAAAASFAVPAAAAGRAAVADEVIVRYKKSATRAERAHAQRATGTSFAGRLPGGTRELEIEDGESLRETLRELRRHGAVEDALPNYRVRAAEFIPNDPGRGGFAGWRTLQWNFSGPAGVNAPAGWDTARQLGAPGGRGATVAIIDSGVAYENRGPFRRAPDLYAGRFVRGYDWVERDTHPNDEESHGTHVAGTIAQKTNNGAGVTGLAYGVNVMPLRVLDANGDGDGADVARALRYAVRNGADVVNMSVEFDTSSVRSADDIPDVVSALRYANSKGVVLVAASGNEGIGRLAYPARVPQVISVGATTASPCLAEYSNGGSGLDLVAPGGGEDAPLRDNPRDRESCDPARSGRAIVQQTLYRSLRRFELLGYDGTSFSTPHVSAAAALLIATKRLGENAPPSAIEARLKATARDLGPDGYDARYGAGLLDVGAALGPG